MSKEESDAQKNAAGEEDDDEPDECGWEARASSSTTQQSTKAEASDCLAAGFTGSSGSSTLDVQSLIGLLFFFPLLEENSKMSDCYWEKKDWRLCAQEMTAFRECWKAHNNDNRTETKVSDKEKK
ncbi:hypothetical protein BGZ63DRAFT_401761 [Mariannaea sp. PMI_226]|nr:hypothetical protein BGZ63DRAFT_401761 [Mariannaea sp. PMI_226]